MKLINACWDCSAHHRNDDGDVCLMVEGEPPLEYTDKLSSFCPLPSPAAGPWQTGEPPMETYLLAECKFESAADTMLDLYVIWIRKEDAARIIKRLKIVRWAEIRTEL